MTQAGLLPEEIEKWILLDSSNSINRGSDFLYRIAATIPDQIIELLLSKQVEDVFYFGSVLRITQSGSENFYALGFYTAQYTGVGDQFLIGRTNYGLKNFEVDYQPYLNSSEYINLDITFRNLELGDNFFATSIKLGELYGLTQINQSFNEISSRTVLFSETNSYEYYAVDQLSTNFFTFVPNDVYNTINITPSIYKLAKYNPFGDIKKNSKKKGKTMVPNSKKYGNVEK